MSNTIALWNWYIPTKILQNTNLNPCSCLTCLFYCLALLFFLQSSKTSSWNLSTPSLVMYILPYFYFLLHEKTQSSLMARPCSGIQAVIVGLYCGHLSTCPLTRIASLRPLWCRDDTTLRTCWSSTSLLINARQINTTFFHNTVIPNRL